MPARPPKHRPHKADAVAHVPAEAVRLTTAQRGYGGRWQKARETFLKRDPLCAECRRCGRVPRARSGDHGIPQRGDQDRFWATSNWQPLCKRCHDVKTAGEDGGFGNRPRGARLTSGRT